MDYNNLYIGERYIPIFDGDWNDRKTYEPLTIVNFNNGSYISKRYVPAGILPTDTNYWAPNGTMNGYIAHLQNEIDAINNVTIPAINSDIGEINSDIDDLETFDAAGMYAAFKNKKILIIGDSLSDETVQAPNWVARLRAKCADIGTQIDNLSVAGLGWTSPNPNSGGLIDQLNSVTDIYDYVILFAGVNDYNSQIDLGSATSTNRTTFVGALYTLHNVLHTKCPSAVVYYCTSPHVDLWTQAQKPVAHNRYRSRAYVACQRFGWLMIDTTILPGYNLIDWPSEYSDGIHVKPNYSQRLCDHIVKGVMSGGENPKTFYNRYEVDFDAPYTSKFVFDFYNDGRVKLTFIQTEMFTAGNKTVVASPDGGYVNNQVIAIPTLYGTVGVYMWSSGIIINVPENLPNGYSSTYLLDVDDYVMPIDY